MKGFVRPPLLLLLLIMWALELPGDNMWDGWDLVGGVPAAMEGAAAAAAEARLGVTLGLGAATLVLRIFELLTPDMAVRLGGVGVACVAAEVVS